MGRLLLLVLVSCVSLIGQVQGKQYNKSDCPTTCYCEQADRIPTNWGLPNPNVFNGISIKFCRTNPYDHLFRIIEDYPTVDGIEFRILKYKANRTEYMTKLLSHMSNMTSLSILTLSSNSLDVLPDNIWMLSKLVFLNIQSNSLREIPDTIGELKLLQKLDISSNILTHLPHSIVKLKSLRHLWVYNNRLVQMPDDIGQLSSLTVLVAHTNQLSQLPNTIYQFEHEIHDHDKNRTYYKLYIDFSHNNLHDLHNVSNALNITDGELVHLMISGRIVLTHNPLRCVCEDYNIYQGLTQDPKLPSFTCGVPDNLGLLEQVDFRQVDFRCPTKSNCLDGCNCTDIPNQNLLKVDCRNYTGKVVPHKMPSPVRNTSKYRYTLDFEGGSLTYLGYRDYLKKVVNASFSKNRIKEIPMSFFENTKSFNVLKLDNNNITTLPLNIGKWPKKIYLGFNKWRCLCVDKPTIQTIEDNKDRVVDYNDVKCSAPNNQKDKRFIQVINTLCSELNIPFIVVGTLLGVVIMVLIAIGIIYYKRVWVSKTFEWRPFQRDDPDDALKEYDVFVSYSNDDHSYVEDELIPRLRDFGFKVCHHREHFLAGDSIIDNIHTAIFNSKRTLVYFSQAYKDSGFCMHEFRSALTLHVKNNRSHLITIKDTAIDIRTQETHLQSFFQLFTYIDRNSSKFWDNLLYSLPVNRMNTPGNGNVENVIQNEIEMDGQMDDDMAVLIDNE